MNFKVINNECKSKSIIAILFSVFFLVIFNFFFSFIPIGHYSVALKRIIIAISIFLIVDTLTIYYVEQSIFSLSVMFIWLSYLFNYGQVFTNVLFPNHKYSVMNIIQRFGNSNMITALLFAANIIQIVFIGFLFENALNVKIVVKRKKLMDKGNVEKYGERMCRYIGAIICIICFPMRMYYTFSAMQIVRAKGYETSTVEGFSGTYIQISTFCVVGSVMLLLSFANDKKKASLVLGIESVLFLFMMLSGGRIFSVIAIIIIWYCYLKTGHNIRKRNFIIALIFAVIILKVIPVITDLRVETGISINKIMNGYVTSDKSLVLSILDEFGGSIYTVYETMIEVPDKLSFNYGMSYIRSFALIGFNIGGVLSRISQNVEYTTLFENKGSYGGNYVGELYYNFGSFAYIFAIFLGLFVKKISNEFDNLLAAKKYYSLAFLVMPVYAVLMWVRGYFDSFTRGTAWAALLIWALAKILEKAKA